MSLKLDVVVFSVVVMLGGGRVGVSRSLGVAFFLLGSIVGRSGWEGFLLVFGRELLNLLSFWFSN